MVLDFINIYEDIDFLGVLSFILIAPSSMDELA